MLTTKNRKSQLKKRHNYVTSDYLKPQIFAKRVLKNFIQSEDDIKEKFFCYLKFIKEKSRGATMSPLSSVKPDEELQCMFFAVINQFLLNKDFLPCRGLLSFFTYSVWLLQFGAVAITRLLNSQMSCAHGSHSRYLKLNMWHVCQKLQ